MNPFDSITTAGAVLFALFVMVTAWAIMPGLTTYTFPTPLELAEVERVLLPQLVEDDPIFKIFPIVESNRSRLRWRQRDNFTGLQQVRGINGQPKKVQMVGFNEYDFKPGVYGEFVTLDEEEIQERGELAAWDQPVNLTELVSEAQQYLWMRRLDRIRWNIYTLITYGIFTTTDARGVIKHTDAFNINTITAGVPWSTSATAVPMTNIRAAQQLSVGQSVDFGAGAEIWMNQVTANRLLSNTNPNDWFGKRTGGGNTVNDLGDINRINAGNNLPTIVVNDRFYLDDNGNPVKWIPNGYALLFGKRLNNAPVGEYRMTRNAQNDNKPGAYQLVTDTIDREVPRTVTVHDGHNGGPVLFFPGAIVSMNVG